MQFLNNLLGIKALQTQINSLDGRVLELQLENDKLKSKLADKADIDYDTIVDHIDFSEVARKCTEWFDADDIASHMDASEVAQAISLSDVIHEIDVDYNELAEHMDLDAVSDYVDTDNVAEAVCKRLLKKQLVFQSR